MPNRNSIEGAADILATDDRFFRALLDADAEALDELLAPDFVLVDVQAGGVIERGDLIELTRSRAVRFSSIDSFPDEAMVRRYGATAVVVGRTIMAATVPNGSSFTVGSRYTHVFVLGSGGGWTLASAQGTRIAAADSQA